MSVISEIAEFLRVTVSGGRSARSDRGDLELELAAPVLPLPAPSGEHAQWSE